MSDYLLRRPNGAIEGPYQADELRHLAHAGKLSLHDCVSRAGEEKWFPITKIPGVREFVPGYKAPEPTPALGPPPAPAPSGASTVTAPVTAAARPSEGGRQAAEAGFSTPAWAQERKDEKATSRATAGPRAVERTGDPLPPSVSPTSPASAHAGAFHRLVFAATSLTRVGWALIALSLALSATSALSSGLMLIRGESSASSAMGSRLPPSDWTPRLNVDMPEELVRVSSEVGELVARILYVGFLAALLGVGVWLARRMQRAASTGQSSVWWYWGAPAVPLALGVIAFVVGASPLKFGPAIAAGLFVLIVGYALLLAGITLIAWGESILSRRARLSAGSPTPAPPA